MRCITPREAEELFGAAGFRVNVAVRTALVLDSREKQTRIGARPPEVGRLTYFFQMLNAWLPTNQTRLLWVDFWEQDTRTHDEGIVV